MRTRWKVVLICWFLVSCGTNVSPPQARPLFPEAAPTEDCEDNLDNDDDFLIDCEDEDCFDAPPCLPPSCDTLEECQLPACRAALTCYEHQCRDGLDNDKDGDIDCLDPDCAYDPACHKLECPRRVDSGVVVDCQHPACTDAVGCGAPRGDGEPCLDGSGCQSGRCLSERETGYPGGMCASACGQETPCPEGTVCVDGSCLPSCVRSEDCRPGYSCFDQIAEAPVCIPDCIRGSECPGTGHCDWFSGRCLLHGGKRDGARCEAGGECAGGHCDAAGYCFSLCSPTRQSCPPGEECRPVSGSGADLGFCREEAVNNHPRPWEDENLLSRMPSLPLSRGIFSPDPQPSDESDPLFTLAYVHQVSLQMAPEERARLRLGEKEWARAKLVYDGHILEEVGVRLKGGYGSGDELTGKPGFSLKLNAFQRGQTLYGQKKIILNNAIQDPSFLSEHMAYWLYAREGIPAPRTAFAEVTLNGEPYGLYVVVEARDKTFFARRGMSGGSLYEGSYGADLDDVASLEEHFVKDPKAIDVLSHLLQSAPDEELIERLSSLVSLDAFLTAWAIEALYYHWDGYLYQANNYYLYHNPKDGRFLFLPHGADQLFHDAYTRLDEYPMGFLAQRLADTGRVKGLFLNEVKRLLSDPLLEEDFRARVDQALLLIEDAARADPRCPYTEEERRRAALWVREFVPRRREFLRALLEER